jgi:predicted kinase
MNLYLLRGLPGAGKSTIGQNLKTVNFEADQYFMKDGQYKFDPTKLRDAHEWCQNKVERCMVEGIRDISVSNTFTQEWEMQAYIDMASAYGYTVFSIVVENRHGGKNIHNVPTEVLEKMKNRFELKLI